MSLLVDVPMEGVTRITFNRPEVQNAFTFDMYRELLMILRDIQYEAETRVVVLTGAGTGFCSGHDVTTPTTPTWAPAEVGTMHRDLYAMQEIREIPILMRGLPQPVIAAVNGSVAGFGFVFVLAADIAIAGASAKFVNAFHHSSIGSEGGVSYLLPRAVGTQRAAELLLTARTVGAEEAERIGLVLRTVPDDELEAATFAARGVDDRQHAPRQLAHQAGPVRQPQRAELCTRHRSRHPRCRDGADNRRHERTTRRDGRAASAPLQTHVTARVHLTRSSEGIMMPTSEARREDVGPVTTVTLTRDGEDERNDSRDVRDDRGGGARPWRPRRPPSACHHR